jgi:hypothetical protein
MPLHSVVSLSIMVLKFTLLYFHQTVKIKSSWSTEVRIINTSSVECLIQQYN